MSNYKLFHPHQLRVIDEFYTQLEHDQAIGATTRCVVSISKQRPAGGPFVLNLKADSKFMHTTIEHGQEVVNALNMATGSSLTLQDYEGWYNGTSGFMRFDKAVYTLLGGDLYKVADKHARLDLVLRVRLSVVKDVDNAVVKLAQEMIANPARYI